MWSRSISMIRLKHSLVCGLLPLRVDYDEPDVQTTLEDKNETGMYRLHRMFTLTEYHAVSPELNTVIQAAMTGCICGAMYGGFIHSRKAYLEFIERNQATTFAHHFEAKKALQDHVTVNFAKGAISWGWRLSMFTGTFSLVSTCISQYRGKSGILEYATAGGVSGCLFKINLGLRGMIVGTLLGTLLGTFGGGILFTFLKVSGMSMEEIRAFQYRYTQYKAEKENLLMKRLIEDGDDSNVALMKYHDEKTKTSPTLGNIDSASGSSGG